MPVDLKELGEAIREIAYEVRRGVPADDTLIADIAKDHGLKPELLARKFRESFPHGVGPALPTEEENDLAWLTRTFD
ncbi:hypothetical protein RFN29_25780 [Mesorhizobium sp. VK22B]|uniref:HTH araC/xylS-type domain-containing protein n=1 Tax=Mesorhizobium captivum TaxID=3072319 RepID=A0ABU4Z7M3_9HYPH|nr:hypothetical protein [Mesorhizobium sp. VK22B]MDX8494973.1 hypothetical protein [Mesorhizobium sp. VK22B]